jgi:hypothetical protein
LYKKKGDMDMRREEKGEGEKNERTWQKKKK